MFDPTVCWHFIVSEEAPGPEIRDYLVQRLADSGHPCIRPCKLGRHNLLSLVALGFDRHTPSEATTASRARHRLSSDHQRGSALQSGLVSTERQSRTPPSPEHGARDVKCRQFLIAARQLLLSIDALPSALSQILDRSP